MEKLMQYVWQHRLWRQNDMRTVDGRRLQVIDPGRLNNDAGPDFFNAKISIDGRIWAGNVEIHFRASDWHRHGHSSDRAYDSVVLHVVDRDDAVIRRSDGQIIPQMRMPCSPDLHLKYGALVGAADRDIPCAGAIKDMPSVCITDWMSTLGFERLYAKAERLEEMRRRFGGDWEQAVYISVARCLGFSVNSEPFERLAMSLPLMFIGKHADSQLAVEALLFGQSGLLDRYAGSDPYAARLSREYAFLSHKFGLRAPEALGWKMARMRPPNLPYRRIAVLASLIRSGFRMTSRLLAVRTIDDAMALFSPAMDGYWSTRYTFGPEGNRTLKAMSRESVTIMTINCVAPLMMAYGTVHGDTHLTDRASALLHSLAPENNRIVAMFCDAGIKVTDAFTSQALVELRRNYCEKRKCLYCRIGHRMLADSARRRE